MRKFVFIGTILASLFLGQANAQSPPEEKLFKDAKILLFSEKWREAQAKLEELLNEYPGSPLASQATFYRAKCLASQKGKEKDALNAYEKYVLYPEKNASLTEEAETSIIELAFELSNNGEKGYREKIEDRLGSSNRVVKYYAAFKLSEVADKRVARRAIPVLMEIISEEKDAGIKDRAKIALLRVSPDSLKDIERKEEKEEKVKILKIRVFTKGKKEPDLSLNIPWALADLALRAIPEKDRNSLKAQGYDLDRIINDLSRGKGTIIEIEDEESIIKIWIDKE